MWARLQIPVIENLPLSQRLLIQLEGMRELTEIEGQLNAAIEAVSDLFMLIGGETRNENIG